MKHLRFIYLFLVILGFASFTNAQTECPHPSGCVTISKDAAVRALTDSDTVAAQKTELAAKDQAIEDLKKIIVDLKIELAKMSGDKTGAEQMVVRLTAILDIMIKQVRPKKIGFINLF